MIALLLLLSVPIEDVARELGAAEPVDWCEVLTRATADARWSFREIDLGPRRYDCRSSAMIGSAGGRPVTIRGSGPADWSSSLERGSVLFWSKPTEKPAMVVLAAGTTIEGVKLQSLGPKVPDPGFPSAIKIVSRSTIRDVALMNWRVSVAGVEVHGNGEELGTDASLMRVEGLRINGVWGAGKGIWVHGADANAGLYAQVSVANVQNATSIHEASQLGNTWTACHIHPSESSELTGAVNRSPPVVADARGARSAFINCYLESGTQAAVIVPPNVWIGGMGGRVSGGGMVLAESELRGARLRAPTIVSEKYDTVGLQRLMRFEVSDGPLVGDIDTIEVSYDGRLNRLTTPASPLRATWGCITWQWQGRREVLRWSMRAARGEWRPPL